MRANDLIWSSVVNHYLLDKPAPPSDLLYWFEDGARIPAAFLKSYNRDLLLNNRLQDPAGFEVGGVAIDLAAIEAPMLVIALEGRPCLGVGSGLSRRARHGRRLPARRIGPQCRGDQPARRQQAWLLDQQRRSPKRRPTGSTAPTRHEGSWWPHWTDWLDAKGKRQAGRRPHHRRRHRTRPRQLREGALIE